VIACREYPELPAGVPIVDAVHPADGPGALCRSEVWHVAPLMKHRQAALSIQSMEASAVAWHHSLERFGAGQLNARFRAAGIAKPGAAEWLGWMAVKCLWEAELRNQPLNSMAFDGHKGRRLYFGANSRNLIQPLYVVPRDASIEDKVLQEWNPPENAEDPPCARS
jgi:hypothetical protein